MRLPSAYIVILFITVGCVCIGCQPRHTVTIMPGSRLGEVYMGETIDSVMAKLGKPQLGDAAMGHAWGTWLDTVKVERRDTTIYRTDVYLVVTGEYLGGIKTVHQIRTTDPNEYAADGLHVGSTLKEIQQVYKHIRPAAWRPRKNRRDSVITYDAISQGIAFDMVNSTKRNSAGRIYKVCGAIIIHIPGKPANEIYLPLFSGERSLLRGREVPDSLNSQNDMKR